MRWIVVILAATVLAAGCAGSDGGEDGVGGSGDGGGQAGMAPSELLAGFDENARFQLAADGETAWLAVTLNESFYPSRPAGLEVWARDLDGERWTKLPDPPMPSRETRLVNVLRAGAGAPVVVFEECRGPIDEETGCQDLDPRYSVVTWDTEARAWVDPVRFRLGTTSDGLDPVVAGGRIWLASNRGVRATVDRGSGTELAGVPLDGEGEVLRTLLAEGVEPRCGFDDGTLVATATFPPEVGDPPEASDPYRVLRISADGAEATQVAEIPQSFTSPTVCDDTQVFGTNRQGELLSLNLVDGELTPVSDPDAPPGRANPVPGGYSEVQALRWGFPNAGSVFVSIPLRGQGGWQRLEITDLGATETAVVTDDRYLAITDHGRADQEAEPDTNRRFVEVFR